MSKTKHTPGPWHMLMQEPDESIEIHCDDGSNIATVLNTLDFPCIEESMDAEAQANANLIAAAPDLYGALKALYEAHTQEHLLRSEIVLCDEEIERAQGRAERLARAALAKAEGVEK